MLNIRDYGCSPKSFILKNSSYGVLLLNYVYDEYTDRYYSLEYVRNAKKHFDAVMKILETKFRVDYIHNLCMINHAYVVMYSLLTPTTIYIGNYSFDMYSDTLVNDVYKKLYQV